MLLYPLGVEGGVVCGVLLGDWLGFPTKVSPRKDEPTIMAMFHLWRLNGKIPGTPPDNGGRSKRRLDRRGSVGTIWVLTKLGFGKIWWDWVYDQDKFMATYIKQSENEMNFPFNLIYVINQEKNGFVCLWVILKILEDLLHPHALKSN